MELRPDPTHPTYSSLPHALQRFENIGSASGVTDASGVSGSSQSVAPRMSDQAFSSWPIR